MVINPISFSSVIWLCHLLLREQRAADNKRNLRDLNKHDHFSIFSLPTFVIRNLITTNARGSLVVDNQVEKIHKRWTEMNQRVNYQERWWLQHLINDLIFEPPWAVIETRKQPNLWRLLTDASRSNFHSSNSSAICHRPVIQTPF